ncbi:MAG: MarR family transcriptional regulator [Thermoproteota archaeon]
MMEKRAHIDGNKGSVILKREKVLKIVQELCRIKGSFTVGELASTLNIPRSTANDWVARLLKTGLLERTEAAKGRRPARYIRKAPSEPPISPCKRIFVTLDFKSGLAEIYHECMSVGALNYCAKEYSKSGGSITHAFIEGPLLRLRTLLSAQKEVKVGKPPLPAIGVVGFEAEGEEAVILVKAFGGPSYSLIRAMNYAYGVQGVEWLKRGEHYYGKIKVRAYEHLSIGIDDTDKEGEGATWALAIELMGELKNRIDVELIGHKVVQLYPYIDEKTGGNYASLIEVAVPPNLKEEAMHVAYEFVASKTKSPNTSLAFLWGLLVPAGVKNFLSLARKGRVTVHDALNEVKTLREVMIKEVTGSRGCIGAMAALACSDPSVSMV